MREMVGGCCVCSDDRGWSENPLVYCDGQSCTVAVHQGKFYLQRKLFKFKVNDFSKKGAKILQLVLLLNLFLYVF